MKIAMILSTVFLLAACSKKEETQKISYDYTENSCPTGRHEFESQEALCDGLKNDSLNNNCARNLRYQEFKQKCPAGTWN